MDTRTVEILRECVNAELSQRIRRSAVQPGVLIFDITEQYKGGRRPQRRLVMEKR
jgi:hypothetical protein